jgi:hypothetical protein
VVLGARQTCFRHRRADVEVRDPPLRIGNRFE